MLFRQLFQGCGTGASCGIFMIANKKIIERGTLLKQFTDVHTNILAQMIVYEYYKNYDIRNILQRYPLSMQKSEYMCKLIREKLPKEIKVY